MDKKTIAIIICIIIVAVLGIILVFNNRQSNDKDNLDYYQGDTMYKNISKEKDIIETIENTTIQGIVELNHNGYIYIFNGQHFGEYGFEMEEYTRTNIDNKGQVCIDYYTSEEHNTSYIQEGDIIICKGNLKKYSMWDDDFDTKENPIIVLKAKDYNTIKKETINGERTAVITVGEYYEDLGEIYIKYSISDKGYNLPFVLKFNTTNDTKIIGDLEKGKEIKVQYKELNVPINELELTRIEVVEK